LGGVNCSVFAYGQTGSGKTYTISGGSSKKNGLVQQTIQYLRARLLAKPPKRFSLKCTMCQVYKSELADLFLDDYEIMTPLEVIVSESGEVMVSGVKEIEPVGFLDAGGDERLIKIFNNGLDNRLMRETDANATSSRSHLLFTIKLETEDF